MHIVEMMSKSALFPGQSAAEGPFVFAMPRAPLSPPDRPLDVLIVGGGLVGTSLACALAQAGFEVAAVDREAPTSAVAAAYDGRASAIALASQRALDAIGVWPHLAAEAEPILDIRVSEQGSPFFLHYDSTRLDGEPFGYMVENQAIRRALLARRGALERLRYLAPERVQGVSFGATGIDARLASGQTLRARLAVGADGRGSQLRAAARIRTTGWSYDQVAIVCTVGHERPHGGIAHERFLPAGPFAILPLQGNRCSIVWTEPTERAPDLLALGEADFLVELGRRFGDFLGRLEVIGPRWSYPLALQFAETPVGPRLALVGDAAHAIHPIAGQGLNLGLRDVAALAEVLVDARRLGLDIGGAGVLERYAGWRRFDNMTMMAMTDGLTRLFSNDLAPLKAVRDLGLAAVNRIEPLKRFFTRHAMGLTGDLPRLLEGRPL